jgi:hypothetical protein
MAEFLRPEARAALLRWREALIGAACLLIGGWLLFEPGLLRLFGYAALILGAVLVWEGIRRARLPRDGGGAGVVEIDERQITYFGPDGGGAVSVEGLRRIEARPTGAGRFLWVFHGDTGTSLAVPSNAEGALRIFDALSVLKGLDIDGVIAASQARGHHVHVVWERERKRLH